VILVLGDYIDDIYEFYTATRLCPEGPVPVLVHTSPGSRLTAGGAGLVVNQLNELEPNSAVALFGSCSNKTRVFADDRLMLRIDDDSFDVTDPVRYRDKIGRALMEQKFDAIIVSDYGKGAFDSATAYYVSKEGRDQNIPVFVDAKNNPQWYSPCFCVFPNEKEPTLANAHTIRKLGPNGCEIDGVHIPTNSHPGRDVTGAGDVFIAAFVYDYLRPRYWEGTIVERPFSEKIKLERAAEFANKVAGISVEYVGTHVVSLDEIKES
jgi:bifunctional ADP-heptose synthase (sugar kinase/adenylyltransferase)